jgi:hypothetical protein
MEPIKGPALSKESLDHSITATCHTLQENEKLIRDAVAYSRILKFEVNTETLRILTVLYGDLVSARQEEKLACLVSEALDRLGWKFYIHPTDKQSTTRSKVFKFHIGRRMAYDGQ